MMKEIINGVEYEFLTKSAVTSNPRLPARNVFVTVRLTSGPTLTTAIAASKPPLSAIIARLSTS